MKKKKTKKTIKKNISDLIRVGADVLQKKTGMIVLSYFEDVAVRLFLRDLLSSCGNCKGHLAGERGRGSPASDNSWRSACKTR